MAEPPPVDFVERPEELESLIDLLTAPADSPVAMAAALRGAGGYGKTTLARAVCRDPRIRAAFPDGILWLTLGEQPRDLAGYVEDLLFILDGEKQVFASLDTAAAHWERRIAERRMLLVLDDVWQHAHLEPFLRGGPRCRRLVTTRDRGVLPAGVRVVEIDAMRQREALELLTAGVPAGNRDACRRLAERLGYWPLLLRLANGVLRFRLEHLAQGLAEALIYLHRALDERGLTAFDAARPTERHQAVATTLGVSLDQLTAEEKERYKELAVFPEDVAVPLAALEILWDADPQGTLSEALCARFFQLSLLSAANFAKRFVRVHDVVREYLVDVAGDQLPGLNRSFLHSFLRLLGSEETLGENGWPWRWIAVASLDQRLLLFEPAAKREPRVFEGHEDEVNDCVFSADGEWIISASDDETVRIWDTSRGSLVRVLVGHDGPVRGCALQGHLLAAVALNVHGSTLRLWDVRTGTCPLVLRLDSELDACSWFPDGTALVAAGEKGLFVFDLVDFGGEPQDAD